MKRNFLLIFVLLTALYACGVKSAQKSAGDAMSAEVKKGHELYMGNCGKCHPAFEVKSKSVDRWKQVLQPMIVDKAKMSEADGKLVEAYVWHELGVSK